MGEIFLLSHYSSPLGTYMIAESSKGVACMKPEKQFRNRLTRWKREKIEVKETDRENRSLKAQLDGYFAGQLHYFKIPLDLRGTPFQHQVWAQLCAIPWGETRSYGQIALTLGHPKAARAVGRAVGTNPVSIVVPCHRVIGSNGNLTGYGGGLDRKTALLELEGYRTSN